LNGRLADDENGVAGIPPIFHQSFSKEKYLRSWAACGAVLCMRQAIHHRTVCHEWEPSVVQPGPALADICSQVIIEYQQDSYDWASKNMKELEMLNHASCQWLL
jgi:hypothetical protein